jgi:hypothetical protein
LFLRLQPLQITGMTFSTEKFSGPALSSPNLLQVQLVPGLPNYQITNLPNYPIDSSTHPTGKCSSPLNILSNRS